MHELAIATEIISIAEREMVARHLNRLKTIGVRIGALSGVNSEALSFGFEAATAETSLADTKLEIEQLPIKGYCPSCKKEISFDDLIRICPLCGSTEIEITQGEELDITFLEGE
jgi:hydrogenase nickel incorporation protein HypA/HybF